MDGWNLLKALKILVVNTMVSDEDDPAQIPLRTIFGVLNLGGTRRNKVSTWQDHVKPALIGLCRDLRGIGAGAHKVCWKNVENRWVWENDRHFWRFFHIELLGVARG